MATIRFKKPKILTIILILFALYLMWSAYDYRTLRENKWALCEEKESAMPELKSDTQFNRIYDYDYERSWDSWQGCLEDYGSILMMYHIEKFFAIVFIFMGIIYWKFDNLNKS